MSEKAWYGWAGIKIISEVTMRTRKPDNLMQDLKGDIKFDGQKGRRLSFRHNGQLDNQCFLVKNNKVIEEIPVHSNNKHGGLDLIGKKMRPIKIILTLIIWCGGVMHPHANEVEYILVTNEKSDSVSLNNLTTLELVKEIKVGKRPRGLGLAPNKSEIYVAVSGENKIKVIETDNFQITRTFYSGDDPESFAVHPSGLIFISNEEIAQTSVIDPSSGKIIAKIEVGIEPEGVSISPDGNTVVVTSESSNMAHFISSSNYKITKNVII